MIKKENLWPLGLAVMLTTFVVILVGQVVLSHLNRLDLVHTEYYEQGTRYQQQIERINRGKQEIYAVQLDYDRSNRFLRIQFPKDIPAESISGSIVLFRPSDAYQDRSIAVAPDKAGQQVIDLKNISEGLWRIKIFWQINALEFYYEEKLVIG